MKQEKQMINLSEQKKLALELLIEFDDFCKKNGIQYFLSGGTLLGAIRHKGFIPWDDDIDVCMLREDYEKFIEKYQPSKEKYKLLSLETSSEYYYPFAKLVNDATILIENGNTEMPLGVYIDIFQLDNCPGETHAEACKILDSLKFYRWIRNFKIIKFSKGREWYKNLILFVGKVLSILVSRRKIAEVIDKKAKGYQGENCKFVGGLTNNTYGYGEVYERYHLRNTVDVEFEGRIFPAPVDYDFILSSMYGDYMKLPPVEKRVSHHTFKCWYK